MMYYVQVNEEAPGQFSAQWPGLPDSRVVASSREAALTELKFRLHELVKNGAIVAVEVNGMGAEPSDVKNLDEMYLDAIRKHREELDAREGVWKVAPGDDVGCREVEEARRARAEELKGTIWDYDLR